MAQVRQLDHHRSTVAVDLVDPFGKVQQSFRKLDSLRDATETITIFEVADRVVVLRLGAVVHDGPISALTQLDLVHLMAGLTQRPETATSTPHGASTEVPA